MRKIDKSVFTHVNYAHRGLHDIKNGIPENSLAAFRLSAEAGYGTEFDIQLSRDGQVVVFHDDNLKRVCGVDARVDSLDYDELKKLRLLGTDEYIPLFTEVLDVFRGTTAPLIVELKTGRRNDELCDKAIKILSGFDGNFCIESFNPFIVNRFRKKAPHICRGQLASEISDYIPEQKKNRCVAFVVMPIFLYEQAGLHRIQKRAASEAREKADEKRHYAVYVDVTHAGRRPEIFGRSDF